MPLSNLTRPQLMKVLAWYVGVRTGFSSSPGYLGKYLQEYLEPQWWTMLLATYSDAAYDTTWAALLAMGDLFRIAATRVAEHFGFVYPCEDDERVSAHLRHVRSLPKDAAKMY